MSSPTTIVNTVMQWLIGLFNVWLPTLPLSGVWAPFQALWELPISGPLPDPKTPLPWDIGVTPDWTMPIVGVRLIPAEISIVVTESSGSPDVGALLAQPREAQPNPTPPKKRVGNNLKESSKTKTTKQRKNK
jgi:hypothetical protein